MSRLSLVSLDLAPKEVHSGRMLARVRDKLEELLASLQSMEKTVEARLYDPHPPTAETDVLMVIEESLDRVQFTVCELRGAIELENELESEGDISSCGPRGRVSFPSA